MEFDTEDQVVFIGVLCLCGYNGEGLSVVIVWLVVGLVLVLYLLLVGCCYGYLKPWFC